MKRWLVLLFSVLLTLPAFSFSPATTTRARKADPVVVAPATARLLPINRRQHKSVIATMIDGAVALVLCFCTRYDHPFVAPTLEVEIARLELNLGVACWHARAIFISVAA